MIVGRGITHLLALDNTSVASYLTQCKKGDEIMKKLFILATLFLAADSAHAGAFLTPPSSGPVVIVNDGGGLVDRYKNAVYRYSLEKRRVEIRGSCRSACTLALAVPTTCVGPGAVLKWHHAYNQDTGIPVYSVTQEMMAMTPSNVRRVVEPNIGIEYNEGATLTYRQLVRLGVPDCDFRPPNTFVSTTPNKTVAVDTVGLASVPTFLTPTKVAPKPKKATQSRPKGFFESLGF